MFLNNYFSFNFEFFRSIYLAIGAIFIPVVTGFVFFSLINKKYKSDYLFLYPFIGFSIIILIEQNLVYKNITINESSLWLLVTILILLAVYVFIGRLKLIKFKFFTLVLAIGVWLINSFGYLRESAEWYIGYGWQDQYNYVATAEFLKENKFSTEFINIDTPYLVEPIVKKNDRIGQSIYQSFISSIFNLSAEYTYGAVSLLAPLLTYCAFLYAFSKIKVREWIGEIMSFIAAILPATSAIHLECFLSQALGTPFLLVTIFKILFLKTKKLSIKDLLIISLLIAGTNSIYTEYTIFILVVLVAKLVIVLIKRANVIRTYFAFSMVLLLSMIMNIKYINPTLEIFKRTNLPDILSHVYPFNHTMYGYSRLLFGDLNTSNNRIIFFLTIIFYLLGLVGLIWICFKKKSMEILVLLCFSVTPVLLDIIMRNYPYQTYKLLLSFTPLILLGWGFLFQKLYEKYKLNNFHLVIVTILLVLIIFIPSYSSIKLSNMAYLGGGRSIKPIVNTKDHQKIYEKLKLMQDKNIFLNTTHPYELSRMAYFGRSNHIWFFNPIIGDFDTSIIPNFEFTDVDNMPEDVIRIDGIMSFPIIDQSLPVYAFIDGSIEGNKGNMWSWLGMTEKMMIYSKEDRKINIIFSANSGPANVNRKRIIQVKNIETNKSADVEFVESISDKKLDFFVKKGLNLFVFQTVYPQTVDYIPENDKRIFMVMLRNLSIQ